MFDPWRWSPCFYRQAEVLCAQIILGTVPIFLNKYVRRAYLFQSITSNETKIDCFNNGYNNHKAQL